jgi:hypothetical protein
VGVPWWQIAGFFAGGLVSGAVFIALAIYEERRAARRDDDEG